MTEHETVVWHHQIKDKNMGKPWEMVRDRETWHAAVHWVAKSQNLCLVSTSGFLYSLHIGAS